MSDDITAGDVVSTAGHVAKRILLGVLGFFVSVLVGLLAIVAIYSVLASLPQAPDYFHAFAMTPLAVLFVPPLGLFVYMITCIGACIPVAITSLLSEIFGWRSIMLHCVFGLAASMFAFFTLWPEDVAGAVNPYDIAIIAASGFVGGFIYWLIAGRDAGFRRGQPQ